MKFTDIVELAKQGYTPADIRELMSLTDEGTTTPNVSGADDPAGANMGDSNAGDAGESDQTTQGDKPTDEPDASAGAIDYKAEYEKLCAQLKNAQKDNINKNMEGQNNKVTDEDTVAELLKSFM